MQRQIFLGATLGFVIGGLFFASPKLVRAQTPTPAPAQQAAQAPDCPPGTPPGITCLKNPIRGSDDQSVTSIPTLIGTIIKVVLSVLGSVALFKMVEGGVTWLMSAGNPEKITAGRDTMLWAALGVFLVLASYFAVQTYINFLTSV